MFSVIFEVHPRSEKWDAYLSYAKALRPELEKVDGFVDNVRYRSLTREGWLLSLSSWRDEKAVVRWRTHAQHHGIQEKGRTEIFLDYHLRVGQVTDDTACPRARRSSSSAWTRRRSARPELSCWSTRGVRPTRSREWGRTRWQGGWATCRGRRDWSPGTYSTRC